MKIEEKDTIATVVRKNYRTAEVFNQRGLDFCCGGKMSIGEACQEKGIDTQEVIQELNLTMEHQESVFSYDVMSNSQLIKHIVEVHHQYVEDNVPYLSQLLGKIASVHGEKHPELLEIRDIFDEATDELYDHMKKEEMILFPAIELMEQAESNNKALPPFGFGDIENPLRAMEQEHDFEGDAFKKIIELTDSFTTPADACSTYTVAFAKLKEFVNDLFTHIHLENNILFENARKLETGLAK